MIDNKILVKPSTTYRIIDFTGIVTKRFNEFDINSTFITRCWSTTSYEVKTTATTNYLSIGVGYNSSSYILQTPNYNIILIEKQ